MDDPLTCRYCGGSVRVTALDLPLTFREDPATAARPRQFVMVGAGRLVHRCEIPADVETMFDSLFFSGVVHQAVGMVSAQADCSTERALEMMQATATASQVTLEQLAEAVVERTVRFD